eukprot:3638707-Pyramimonas_sp.AAC.1
MKRYYKHKPMDGGVGYPAQAYIAALYWTLTTATTVGYGDITPVTRSERVFAMFVYILAALAYSSIFANVSILVQTLDSLGRRVAVIGTGGPVQ